jgi:hypothetical protein
LPIIEGFCGIINGNSDTFLGFRKVSFPQISHLLAQSFPIAASDIFREFFRPRGGGCGGQILPIAGVKGQSRAIADQGVKILINSSVGRAIRNH